MSGRASILMYHSIGERNEYFFNVALEDFAAQMRFLSEKGYKVISLRELVRRLHEGVPLDGEIVVTFDDGYKDNYENAFPILKQYDLPATIFVTTDLIGTRDKRDFERLSALDLRTLSDSGLIDIEPHTKTHPKLAKLVQDDAREEIVGAKEELERILGKTCDLFAYPYGNYSDETALLVRGLGFAGAITVEAGTVRSGDDLVTLHRNSIDRTTSRIQFVGKLSRAIDRYESLKKLIAWA